MESPSSEAPVKTGAGSLTMKVGDAYKTTTDEEDQKYPKNRIGRDGVNQGRSALPLYLRRLSNNGSSIDDLINFQGIQDFFLQKGFGQSP